MLHVSGSDFARLHERDAPAHLVLVANPPHHPGGDFGLVDGRVGNDGDPLYTFSGIACYRSEFFADIDPGKRALAPLLREAAVRGEVSGEIFDGDWTDIGTPERLDELNRAGR